MSKKYQLNAEEQAIEDQYESLRSVKNKQLLIDDLIKSAKQRIQHKKAALSKQKNEKGPA